MYTLILFHFTLDDHNTFLVFLLFSASLIFFCLFGQLILIFKLEKPFKLNKNL